jgi:hypothetical protein
MNTVTWLSQNFEIAEGASIHCSTLYSLYECHCNEINATPIASGSLQRIVRDVFVSLQTVGLETRGEAKYHYPGISVIPGSEASQMLDDKNFGVCLEPSQKQQTIAQLDGWSRTLN